MKKATATKAAVKKTPAKKAPAKKAATKAAAKTPHETAAKKVAGKAARKTEKSADTTAAKEVGSHSGSGEKNSAGGLTAAGRRAFHEREGANLKPGVGKPETEMTPEEMKRKGSWAARFYGRKSLPPLVDKQGKPTRFALSAHAWGEPVPKTEAEARKIAEKGRALLARYQKTNSA